MGHSFVLLDVSHWMQVDKYYERMEQFLRKIKASPRGKGIEEIHYPGERRYLTYLENKDKRIALPETVQEELESLGREHRVTFPGRVEA